MKIVDTTFLVDLSRNNQDAIKRSQELDKEPRVYCTEVSVYEIILGVYSIHDIDHNKKMQKLEEMFNNFHILALDHNSAIKSGQIAGELIRGGKPIDDTDCMIAGIALANGINTVITRNKEHFQRVKGIKVEGY